MDGTRPVSTSPNAIVYVFGMMPAAEKANPGMAVDISRCFLISPCSILWWKP